MHLWMALGVRGRWTLVPSGVLNYLTGRLVSKMQTITLSSVLARDRQTNFLSQALKIRRGDLLPHHLPRQHHKVDRSCRDRITSGCFQPAAGSMDALLVPIVGFEEM